jgi:hypothetical protein
VPGIYYYISLAEDTLARLNLAPAEGKSEIDSSLDHVVRVPPLSWNDSRELVRSYFAKRGFSATDDRVATMIATVSFGVPRDVIRRCDEMLATYEGKLEGEITVPDVAVIAASVRRDRVELAGEREGWNLETYDRLMADPKPAADAILAMLTKEADERVKRLLAMLWILCACEITCSRVGKRAADEWDRLYRLGYDLPTRPISDILTGIAAVAQSQKTLDDGADSNGRTGLSRRKSSLAIARAILLTKRNGGDITTRVPH